MLYQDADTPFSSADQRPAAGLGSTGPAGGGRPRIPGYDLIMSFSMKAVPGAEFDADPDTWRST